MLEQHYIQVGECLGEYVMIKFLEIMEESEGQLYLHQDLIDLIAPVVYEDSYEGGEEHYLRIETRDHNYFTKTGEKIRWVTLEEMQRRCNKFIEGGKDE